jgi:methyl-accepting chemotaxis protein
VSSVKRVTDIMAEITAASQEQSSGIEQVNTAITQMDQTTQQNAALVEEAAAAAESMQEQAENLTQAVSVFRLAAGAMNQQAHRVERAAPAAGRPGANVRQLTPRSKAKPQAPARMAAARTEPAGAKTGTDGEWSEF